MTPFTMPGDLLREWYRRPGLTERQLARLAELGVSPLAQELAGGVWFERVATAGRLYTPDPAGQVFLLVPVWHGSAPSFFCEVDEPLLSDLVAFRTMEPERFYYRTGNAGFLGYGAYWDFRGTVALHCHPLDWLQGGAVGACDLERVEDAWGAAA